METCLRDQLAGRCAPCAGRTCRRPARTSSRRSPAQPRTRQIRPELIARPPADDALPRRRGRPARLARSAASTRSRTRSSRRSSTSRRCARTSTGCSGTSASRRRPTDTLFGGQATITVTVTDRNGDPVQGATVSFATDWGWLTSSVAVTGASGRAPSQLVGVQTEAPVRLADVGILQRVSREGRGRDAREPGRDRVRARCASSRKSWRSSRATARRALSTTSARICRPARSSPRPTLRTATVTVHARSQGAIVRGVGSVQVRFGRLDPRLGADEDRRRRRSRSRWAPGSATCCGRASAQAPSSTSVVTGKLPFTLQSIHDETQSRLKEHLFVDPELGDADVRGSGLLGQVIAQDATAAVGARTNTAIDDPARPVRRRDRAAARRAAGGHGPDRHRAALVADHRRLRAVAQAALLRDEGGRLVGCCVHGAFRDRAHRAGPASRSRAPWRPNLVLWSALDLIGSLLCNRSEGVAVPRRRLRRPRVGREAAGRPTRAARSSPPRSIASGSCRARRSRYDPSTGRLHAHVSIGPGKATGTLRELGPLRRQRVGPARLGDARQPRGACRAREGRGRHARARRRAHARRRPRSRGRASSSAACSRASRGSRGLTHIALGTAARASRRTGPACSRTRPTGRRLDPHRLAYLADAHTVEASATFEIAEGPLDVREAGLFGGTANDAADTGLLVARDAGDRSTAREPKRLEQRFRLVLVERTGIAVPKLVGRKLDAATAALATAKLQPGEVTRVVTEASPPTPCSSRRRRRRPSSTRARRSPSSSPRRRRSSCPRSSARPRRRWRRCSGGSGSRPRGSSEQSPEPPGTVISRVAGAGPPVPKGSDVALTVAVPVLVGMPDLRGRTPPAAAVVLGAIGLELAPDPYPGRRAARATGRSSRRRRSPRRTTPVGTAVAITLATPWTVEVPDQLGSRRSRTRRDPGRRGRGARRAARPAARRWPASPSARSASGGPGRGRHDPRAVARRGLARLAVRHGRRRRQPRRGRPVPALVGLTQSAAVAALAAAGFAAGAVTQRPSDAAPGTVVDQAPDAGPAWTRGDRARHARRGRAASRFPISPASRSTPRGGDPRTSD